MTGRSLPRRLLGAAARLARSGFFFGILMLAYWLTLGRWTSDQLDRTRRELANHQQEIRKLEAVANRLPEFLEAQRRLEGKLEQTAFALPDARAALLPIEISFRAEQTSVELVDLSASEIDGARSGEFFSVKPLRLEVRGRLTALGSFADALFHLRALEVQAIEIERADRGAYSARVEVRAYEWIPDARSAPPTCERNEQSRYVAAELVASAIPIESRLDEGEGWRRRRAAYRVTRVFKLRTRSGVPAAWWPEEGATIHVVRSCLTTPAPAGRPAWPAPVEYCPESEPTLSGFDSAGGNRAATAERLLLLRTPYGDAGWEPVGSHGLSGLCDAPLPPEDKTGFGQFRSWKEGRDGT